VILGDTSAVLIVDDDPQAAEVLRRLLTRNGYHCTVAADATQARARLAEGDFALALVDVTMPGKPESGLDLITDLLPKHADLAVIMVTPADGPDIAEVATKAGAFGYVVKPFRPSEVLIAVADAGRRRCLEIERRHERGVQLEEPAISEATWRVAFEPAPVAIAELDLDGTIIRANHAMGDLLEVAAGRLEGTRIAAYCHSSERHDEEQRIRAIARGRAKEIVQRHLVTAMGNDRWAAGLGSLVDARQGPPGRILSYLVDSTEAHLAHQRNTDAQARFAALVEHSSDAIVVEDAIEGRIVYASPGLLAVLGIKPEEAVGSSLWQLVSSDDLATADERRSRLAGRGTVVNFDCRARHVDGSWRHLEVTTTNLVDDPAVHGVVNNLHDVSDRVEATARLSHQAMHDSLTGLPNRALLLDRLDQALARAARSGRPCALLFLDLDDFKQINDTLGHNAGDKLLRAVAERLRDAVRPGDSVARFGGDEFVVLAENIDVPSAAVTIAKRARASIAQPVSIDKRVVRVNCSVGIALSDRHSADALLHDADMALYRSKESGGDRWEIYDQAMRAQAERRAQVEDLVRSAIDDGGKLLALHYQPIIDLTTGATIGTEALTYIRRPEGMMVSPGEFIPIAEDSGLIVPLGAAVLDLACAQQARWCAVKASQDHVAVNISGRQLSGSELAGSITDALRAHSLRPDNLCIELTESSLIDTGPNVLARLCDLKAIGVKLALDDFGTGWSSLNHLRRFPIDIVKIDKSVVSGLGANAEDSELVKAVVDLARTLDLTTIAEGVETTTQDGLLREMGCAQAQGFLYGRPQTAP
jgi:diguanylate cyclase (GGDEF)-like protein/PAS domain S-box-containing protein